MKIKTPTKEQIIIYARYDRYGWVAQSPDTDKVSAHAGGPHWAAANLCADVWPTHKVAETQTRHLYHAVPIDAKTQRCKGAKAKGGGATT